MKLKIPEFSLILLLGASSSGKSTFARKHFKSTEVLSSDYCRALITDDENDLTINSDAFEVLRFITAKRLQQKKLTVIDATNVQTEARRPLLQLAKEYHCLPVVIVFDLPEKLCLERHRQRNDRKFGKHVIHQQTTQLKKSLKRLKREGFRYIHTLTSLEDIEQVVFERQPLWCDLRHMSGPFDIIGDIHGCFDELIELLIKLGYKIKIDENNYQIQTPQRKVIFLGDLVDRGPKSPEVVKLVMTMVNNGDALCVPGNHDTKLVRKLQGRNVKIAHGLAETLEQLEQQPDELRQEICQFLNGLVSHYVLDQSKLIVAHAGMKENLQGRASGKVRSFALYGETTGETDEFGLPVRYNWAQEYRGKATVVYGHTPIPHPEWLNNTINIDTGCVFGGSLTALKYPEKELVSITAKKMYCEPVKPINHNEFSLTSQQQYDDILDIADVTGKRIIDTRLRRTVTIREANAITALEVMSRFAANPKWLIYLPPTMSPAKSSNKEGFLEHPEQALYFYKKSKVERVICEEKHMGSRAIVIICRNEKIASDRFGIMDNEIGICYTRTGRRFFEDSHLEAQFLDRVRNACERAKVWQQFNSDWICLDCELMPWSVKAQELLFRQYAALGSSAYHCLDTTLPILQQTVERGIETGDLLPRFTNRQQMCNKFINAYRHYCWPVEAISDFKLAPFHVLATENSVHCTKNHLWHMQQIANICREDTELLLETPYKIADLNDSASCDQIILWWEKLTAKGGEGMVVKPIDFISYGKRGILQPAIKSRGKEYLRIIYGPEYDTPEHLQKLRQRHLATKRSLALREFALGIEALERFVAKQPLRRIHECVFGILALESESVDPRL